MEIVIMILGAAVLFGALVSNGGGVTTNWSAGEADGGDGWQSMFGDEIGTRSSDDMFHDDDFLNNDDLYYSPIYSHLPCNIYHDPFADDDWSSSSDDSFMFSSDDDWSSSTSAFDDDFCGCSSIGIDDDICGCGSSSFDDGIGCSSFDDDFGCGSSWDD
ncbi:hypothetical protein GM415_15515 [Pseudodesulfovibrio cashew]|uniref:Uncharacterized protein n=1 Tax=Pseudodesulfovibrio cashew TaxID=2678688 RepID=A0A6I6JUS3_9BACT|nr:hypothetical protein [Pseudodesulfovibrio cashew]QGY41464.1 hypothetical protein GM415_15515 [Pseudodesulfovibrio cashew]